MAIIAAYFQRGGWAAEELEPGVWRTTFATENEEDFDLYVLLAEDWVHFAVSPLLPVTGDRDPARLHAALLRLNQELRLARFAVDGDGDVNLLADLPLERISYAVFNAALELLVHYTNRLAGELRRTLADPHYHSPLLA